MCPIPLFTTAVIIFFTFLPMASPILLYAIHVRISAVSVSTSIERRKYTVFANKDLPSYSVVVCITVSLSSLSETGKGFRGGFFLALSGFKVGSFVC